jgi:hypothetical protein
VTHTKRETTRFSVASCMSFVRYWPVSNLVELVDGPPCVRGIKCRVFVLFNADLLSLLLQQLLIPFPVNITLLTD